MSQETEKKDVYSGVYQHYKGKKYLVLGLARHTETNERLVAYIPLYTDDLEGPRIQVRPVEMFFGKVEVDGTKKSRFRYLGPELIKTE